MTAALGFTKFDATLMTSYDPAASATLGADYWRVLHPFRYYIGTKDSNQWVDIPAGYLTDGASVPRLFWNIIPPWGKYGQAAVVHDVLCETLTIMVDGVPTKITRAQCDAILLEAMKVLEVPTVTAYVIYGAVCTYRVVCNVTEPSATAQKTALETGWVLPADSGEAA